MRGRAVVVAGAAVALAIPLAFGRDAQELRAPKTFEQIADREKRSVALFEEAGKVILNPRCVNCHPAGDRPLQGADMRPHTPPVARGPDGMGAPGMQCGTCHGAQNAPVRGASIKSVPGNPKWAVAPLAMAWQGQSLGNICRQIKDPGRNGAKTLAQIHAHMAHDELVGWGWAPGDGRAPVPGTQAQFGEIIQAWVETGAACPD